MTPGGSDVLTHEINNQDALYDWPQSFLCNFIQRIAQNNHVGRFRELTRKTARIGVIKEHAEESIAKLGFP